jgi:membrane-bound lytic murein transglycosylase B
LEKDVRSRWIFFIVRGIGYLNNKNHHETCNFLFDEEGRDLRDAMPPCTRSVASEEIARPHWNVALLVRVFAVLLFTVFGAVRATAADWKPLTERLTAEGFNRETMESLFSRPEVLFEPDAMTGKLRALIRSRSASADSLSDTFKKAIRRDYLNHRAITRANSYLIDNRIILEEITTRYGVPKEVIVSILLIETHLGKNTGTRLVFNRLASMALVADLEMVRPYLDVALLTAENEEFARRRCREKSDWAYGELKALLLYAAKQSADPLGIKGSIYGAIGLCQFMPSNVFSYGVDGDGDGRVDLFTKPDALYSIANYLRGHGWREGMNHDDRHRVIFAYNNSTVYANTVLAVAEKIRDRGHRHPGARKETF